MKRPVTVGDLLVHQKKALKRPLTTSPSKVVQKEFTECFKLINTYMEKESMDGLKQLIAFGWNHGDLANEIYAIIIKQTRENPEDKSLERGLELLAICLYFFTPSPSLQELIKEWLVANQGSVIIKQVIECCHERLGKIVEKGNRRGLVEPGQQEIQQAKRHIYQRSMFGVTLDQLMASQKETFPELEIPWIQKELTKEIIRLGGLETEGIFRLPGEIDKVNALKVQVEDWDVIDASSTDPHVVCSLLKLWLREMADPILPAKLTDEILDASDDFEKSIKVVEKLPVSSQSTLLHLIRFLQTFAVEEVILKTRMDGANLAMVMAPNLFRPLSDDPRSLLDNSRREINFLRNLVEGLDTTRAEIHDPDFRVEKV